MATELQTIDCQRFNKLCQAHAELQDEFAALLQCLEKSGTLSRAALHQERFGATLKRYPLADSGPPAPTPAQLLEPPLLRELLRSCGGKELLALKQACSAASQGVEAVPAGRLYAFGGCDHVGSSMLRAAECLDLRTGKWESMPPMKVGRAGNVAGAIGRHVYVCGGFGDLGRIVEKFDLTLQRWETCTPPPRLSVQRAYAASAVIHGRFYICGGEDMDEGVVHTSVECFDPQLANGKGGCEVLPGKMLAARRLHAAVVIPGQSQLVVCGGRPSALSSDMTPNARMHSTTEMLDVSHARGAWQELAPMTSPRCAHTAVCLHRSIYVCGGSCGNDMTAIPTVERFDLEWGCWISLPPTLTNRGIHGAVALADRLYVVGGAEHFCPGAPAVDSAEYFDPATGKWERAPGMLRARLSFALVPVKLGRLLE